MEQEEAGADLTGNKAEECYQVQTKQRAKEKKCEVLERVLEGLCSPGGTRIKVNHLIFD